MRIICLSPVGVTLELENNTTPYFSQRNFSVVLNGKAIMEENRNVFSIFGLTEGVNYIVEACGESAEFTLPKSQCRADVKEFGATGDGVSDDTEAFQAVFCCLPENSVLTVSAGKYHIRPVFLKGGVTLYIEKGAYIIGSPERGDYPVMPPLIGEENFGTWQGEEAPCFASIFTAYRQTGIVIAGEGTIDCNALEGDWYENHRVMRKAWRPRGLFFNRCKGVTVCGVTVKNTPSWNVHPYFCDDVKLIDLTLENIPTMPTTDGIDVDCCKHTLIAGVNISVGDDCIALKSGTLEFAKKYRRPTSDTVIRNCLMKRGHGGVVFGSELSGGIEDVKVSRCLFEGTDRGLRIKTRRGRGRLGRCGGVTFSDIVMKDVKVPFVINMYYNMGDENGHSEYVWTTEKLPVDANTPYVGSFVFENMTCTGVEYSAGAFYGLPEAPIERLVFKNVSFEYSLNAQSGYPDMKEKNQEVKRQGLDFHYVSEVVTDNVTFSGNDGECMLFDHSGNRIQIKKG